MSGDLYVKSVIDHVPYGLPLREQLAMELRGLIAERVSRGQPLDEVLQQLGDPLTLAESYLSAIPLISAGLVRRVAAKAIDAVLVFGIAAAIATTLWTILRPEGFALGIVPGLIVLGATFGFVAYTVIAEYRAGRTLGKRLMGIRVVRESGALQAVEHGVQSAVRDAEGAVGLRGELRGNLVSVGLARIEKMQTNQLE